MSYRTFVRKDGAYWQVWDSQLTFESLVEKRRLIPIPNAWEQGDNSALRRLCDRAQRIAKTDGGTSAA